MGIGSDFVIGLFVVLLNVVVVVVMVLFGCSVDWCGGWWLYVVVFLLMGVMGFGLLVVWYD